ncbi:hypothetical protein [Sorangium sp. So ce363]|uniref:hypothetical protein n=1 Tax=Sorangium sp. So ce363 TaxID=3133304 RepID=UPI003F63C3E1
MTLLKRRAECSHAPLAQRPHEERSGAGNWGVAVDAMMSIRGQSDAVTVLALTRLVIERIDPTTARLRGFGLAHWRTTETRRTPNICNPSSSGPSRSGSARSLAASRIPAFLSRNGICQYS